MKLSVAVNIAILTSVGALAASTKSPAASCTMAASGGDDGPAFLSAVQQCSTVTIPSGVTLNISTRLAMTGLSNKAISLKGTISFNPNIPYWAGNAFQIPFQNSSTFWQFGGTGLTITGGGTIDGQGPVWWSALDSNSTLQRPIILHTFNAKNVLIQGIKMINAPNWHNIVDSSSNVTFDQITINSKTGSPNTDGWDTYRSDSVTIKNSVITNGDDCVAFKPNSTNILVSNLTCTGSHGISVGSVGQYSGVYDLVQNVLVENVKMSDAENGARIKAFAGPGVGSGLVQNITFTNFVVNDTDHPMIIDQCYETSDADCESNPSNVLIQDIFFNNVTGTGSSSTVATLDCSPDGRCSDINVNNISLKGSSSSTKYECQNVALKGGSASLFGTCTTT